MIEIISGILILAGLFFFLVSTIGFIRLPETFTRIHATTVCDTMATFLTLAGLALYSGFNTHSVKLILAIVFIWLTNPTAAHLISKAATHLDSTKGSFYGKNI